MPNTAPLVFFGTPEFAVPSLAALITAGYDIRAVITEPPTEQGRGKKIQPHPIDVWASAHGLPVWRPEKLQDENFLNSLRMLNCPIFVLAAYGRILPLSVLNIPAQGVVNVHPSLLPLYRGPAPIVAALRNGDAETGVSIMLLDQGMDTGPLLSQTHVPINSDDTAKTLSDRLSVLGAELLTKTITQFSAGDIQAIPQPQTKKSPTRFIHKADGHADWRRPAVELERDARAFSPWPALWTLWEGQPLKIIQAQVAPPLAGDPGQVINVNGMPHIVTGNGTLILVSVQPAGGRVMSAQDFLHGHPSFGSARLS